jgi:predicted DsbA family dithiol-disulfide isomerase
MIKSSLDKLAETEDIEVTWKSYELRPQNAPPLPPAHEQAYKERIAAGWPRTQQMAKEVFGVELKTHRWGVKSRLALEGAKFAEEKGLGEAYHEAIFKAHFIEDRDLGDRQVLAGLAEAVGLDQAEFMAALDNPKYAEQVDQDIAQAQAYGLNGVPATIIQDKYLISGAQPLEALQDIVRQVKAREQIE